MNWLNGLFGNSDLSWLTQQGAPMVPGMVNNAMGAMGGPGGMGAMQGMGGPGGMQGMGAMGGLFGGGQMPDLMNPQGAVTSPLISRNMDANMQPGPGDANFMPEWRTPPIMPEGDEMQERLMKARSNLAPMMGASGQQQQPQMRPPGGAGLGRMNLGQIAAMPGAGFRRR